MGDPVTARQAQEQIRALTRTKRSLISRHHRLHFQTHPSAESAEIRAISRQIRELRSEAAQATSPALKKALTQKIRALKKQKTR